MITEHAQLIAVMKIQPHASMTPQTAIARIIMIVKMETYVLITPAT
jgi:hypothetical protein